MHFQIIILLLSLSLFVACDNKPEDEMMVDDDNMVTTPIGRISGEVMHHNIPIPNATVYIKYNASELPGIDSTDYDDWIIATESDAFYEFSELDLGSYYLFGRGYDEECQCDVIGGIPISLVENRPTRETNVPVTE